MAAELTVALIARGDSQSSLRSAASALHQSWGGAKVLKVVDVGASSEFVRRLAHLDAGRDTVEVIRSEAGGIAAARNVLLRSTATRYLAWIDAGDVWHPRKLELQMLALESARLRPAIASCRAYSREADCAFANVTEAADVDPLPDYARAPFSTLVGETEAFKAAGELDEQFALLADAEYLLRVALAGASAAAIPNDFALCGLAARAESAPSQFADEAKLVLVRHQTALAERFGRRAAKAYQRHLMRDRSTIESDKPGAGHDGSGSAAAGGAGRTTSSGSAGNRARWTQHAVRARSAALAKRVGTRLLAANAVDPTHPAVVALVRFLTGSGRSGLASVAPGLAAMAAEGETAGAAVCTGPRPLTPVERSILAVVHACCAAGKLDRAEAILEAHLAHTAGSAAHPRLIERLATVHLAGGRPRRARELLSDALRTYPNEDTLHVALADAFVRAGNWDEATRQWERVSSDGKAAASAGLRTRVARAYRLTGRSRVALAILPPIGVGSADELRRELDKNLRLCADWPECLVPIDVAPHDACGRIEGLVETWGFLAGGREPLKGRLVADANVDSDVSLCVNGMPIAKTRGIGAPGSDDRIFAINCADLLYYLGDGDLIEVTTERGRLELPGGGVSAMVHNGMPTRFGALERKLEQGYVFTKLGALLAGHSEESKRAALDFYAEVAELLETQAGVAVFPFYGNLLGAIRENDFIAHDADGFDVLILCRGRSPSEVKAELADLCGLLRERGFAIDAMPWCVFVRRRPGAPLLLDLSYGWFTESDELNVSFGWRYAPARGRRALLEERRCRLVDRYVRVPGNAEAVLEQLYGPTWRVPDQGFSPLAGLQRDERYLLSEAEIAALLGEPPVEQAAL